MMRTSIAFTVLMIGLAGALVVSARSIPGRAQTALGPDVSHALLFAAADRQDLGTEAALVGTLPRVRAVAELQQALAAGGVNLILIDRASLSLLNPQLLSDQLRQGISLIGLNISLGDLRDASGFDQVVFETEIDHSKSPKLDPPGAPPSEPFYSHVGFSASGQVRRWGQGQNGISSGLLKAEVRLRASSRY